MAAFLLLESVGLHGVNWKDASPEPSKEESRIPGNEDFAWIGLVKEVEIELLKRDQINLEEVLSKYLGDWGLLKNEKPVSSLFPATELIRDDAYSQSLLLVGICNSEVSIRTNPLLSFFDSSEFKKKACLFLCCGYG